VNVWIVNPFDNLPLEGYRPMRYWLMARAFARAGHRVTLFTGSFSHANKCPRALGTPAETVAVLAREGFRLMIVAVPPYPRNICLRRIRSHRVFARNWWRTAARLGERPDAVIASLPTLGGACAAADFAHRAGATFVLDVMDAWPETFYRLGPRFLFAGLRRQARAAYRAADLVTAVAARYLDLAQDYGATAPRHLCHHGIALPPPVARSPRVQGAPLRLVYLGSLGASYDLETVIDAVKAQDDVTLDVVGTGPKEKALRRRAQGCVRIRFHGYLAEEDVAARLAAADVGLVPMFPESCVGVPYKLADYAAAGLPVISSLPGETAEILCDFHAGTTYTAGNMVSFAEALKGVRVLDGFDADGFRFAFDAARLYADYVAFVEKGVKTR